MSLWTLYKIFITSSAKKLKVSKENCMKACRLSKHAFSWLNILLEMALMVAHPTVKHIAPNSTNGETPFKSTHACFYPTYPYTRIFVGLSVDISSYGPVKKFIDAFYFKDTRVRRNISNKASIHYNKNHFWKQRKTAG